MQRYYVKTLCKKNMIIRIHPPAPYLRWVNVGLYEIEASINLSNSLSPKYIRLNL